MRENITTDSVPFRKAYLRSLIDAVEVDDRVIHIHGSRTTLERAIIDSGEPGKQVRAILRKWRSLGNGETLPISTGLPAFAIPITPLKHNGYFCDWQTLRLDLGPLIRTAETAIAPIGDTRDPIVAMKENPRLVDRQITTCDPASHTTVHTPTSFKLLIFLVWPLFPFHFVHGRFTQFIAISLRSS
jgi:hypothetical protein